jgi:TolB protein
MIRIVIALALAAILSVFDTEAQSELPSIPGHIAYIGVDQNVHVLDVTNNIRVQLTSDAGISQTQARIYQWPTWANDNRLAYFGTTVLPSGSVGVEAYIIQRPGSDPELVYSASDETFTYAAWSPQFCGDTPDCRDLAVLLSAAELEAFQVRMIRHTATDSDTFAAGEGVPFYFSWSPDGENMIWHRNNSLLDIYEIEERRSTRVTSDLGAFFAPAWSPVDDRILFGLAGISGDGTDLAIATSPDGETIERLTRNLVSPVSFSWSPNGNQIAYLDGAGTLSVIDVITGESVLQSPIPGVLAFFWSPNSQHIAFVSLEGRDPGGFSAKMDASMVMAQTTPGLLWSVIDISTGQLRRYITFRPTREMAYLLTYFDQFAQSHRIWSPDSRYIVFSEVGQGTGTPSIHVLDVSQTASVPLTIAQGVIGIWSYN